MAHATPPGAAAPTVVLHVFGRMDRGGAETRSVEMLRYVDSAKVHTIYCTLDREGKEGALDGDIQALGAEVINCPLTKGFGKRFKRLLREMRVTAIHSHVQLASGLMCFYAWQVKVPVRIVHWHTTGEEPVSLRKRLQDNLMRLMIRLFATRIVSVGKAAMDSNWPQKDSRKKILYSGLNLDRFDAKRYLPYTRAELGVSQDALVLIHVGRFHPVKNQLFLVKVFAEVKKTRPEARLVLLGGGGNDYEAQVRGAAGELGVLQDIHFVGLVSEVARYLPVGDVMVFPSQLEGLPGSVLEAIASGLPVVASDLPSVAEIREALPEVRTLALTESPSRWAEVVVESADAYRSPAARESLRQHLAASHFNLQACVQGHVDVWEGR